VRIGPTGVGIGLAAAVAGFTGAADHYPLVVLVLQMVLEAHGYGIALPLEGHPRRWRSACSPLNLTVRNFNVHRRHVELGFGEVIDDALTHRVGVFLAAVLAAGETEDQEQERDNTHYSIIPGVGRRLAFEEGWECYIVPSAHGRATDGIRAAIAALEPVSPKAARCPHCGDRIHKSASLTGDAGSAGSADVSGGSAGSG